MSTNIFRPWRGAVQPSENNSSGNEYKRWRGVVTRTLYDGTATYDGLTIPSDSILWMDSGTHDGDPGEVMMGPDGVVYHNNTAARMGSAGTVAWYGSTDLIDSTKTWTAAAFSAMEANNTSDGSLMTIGTSGVSNLPGTLAGGTDNTWDIGDAYNVVIAVDSPDVIRHQDDATVTSEVYSFAYYIEDDSASTDSLTAVATITASGAPDGAGTIALSVKGVPTFTYTVTGGGKKKSMCMMMTN